VQRAEKVVGNMKRSHKTDQIEEDPNFERKLDLITEGARPHLKKHMLERITLVNCKTIIAYILALRAEKSPTQGYCIDITTKLTKLAKFHHPKSFHDMTRDDILKFLDRLRKSEPKDPLHKWKGSYNNNLGIVKPFFIWLGLPDVVENISQQHRKEVSAYKPTELWTEEDDLLFLKYCPSKRDKAWHAVTRDIGARPGELLAAKIKDVVWINTDTYQIAKITINGKTEIRSPDIIYGVPYLKDWLSVHPFSKVENAALFCGEGKKNRGRPLSRNAMNAVYRLYKHEVFPKMLEDGLIEPEDRAKVEELIRNKKWNPYVRRHTAITEKSKILPAHLLNQWAGWKPNSKMSTKYIHYFGNEASDKLLEAAGIKLASHKGEVVKLKPRVCYNCQTANEPDAKICQNDKCRMILRYDIYIEKEQEREQSKKELEELKIHQENIEKTMGSMLKVLLGQSDTVQIHMSEELMDEESIKALREMSRKQQKQKQQRQQD
jgi:integrase